MLSKAAAALSCCASTSTALSCYECLIQRQSRNINEAAQRAKNLKLEAISHVDGSDTTTALPLVRARTPLEAAAAADGVHSHVSSRTCDCASYCDWVAP